MAETDVSAGRDRARLVATGLAAGVLVTASLPPFGWWPLAMVGAAVLAAALRGQPWSRRLLAGFAAGLGLFGPGLWWMAEFSAPGYVAATIVEAAVLAVVMVTVPPGRGRSVAFPAALVLAGALAGHWPFGGVPLASIPLGQAAGPLAPAARLGGHLLLTALVGVSGVSVAALSGWARSRSAASPLIGAAAGLLAVVTITMVGAAAPDGTARGALDVAAVQGGGARGLRAVSVDARRVLDAHLAASDRVRRPVDLVLWPEDVVDVDQALAGSAEEAEVSALAQRLGATLVAGIVEDTEPGRFRNAVVAWAPDGSQVARYDKVHRVPFGEYIPFRSLVDRVADISAVPRDALAGSGTGILRTPAGPLGVVISYEVFFADRARAAVRAGGRVLLAPTNASSFTTSQVPAQELAAARLRALETGRTVVQAAPTGFTAVVDPRGRVITVTDLGPAAVVQRTVTLRSGQTLATRLGDGPLTVGTAAVLVVTFWRRRKVESYTRRVVDVSTTVG